MSTVQQKAHIVLRFAKLDSFVRVQHAIRLEYGVRPPDDKNIRTLCEHYRELGGKKDISGGCPRRSNEMWIVLGGPPCGVRSYQISREDAELQMPKATVHRIIGKFLYLKP
jgi:hypothetical protein